MSSDGAREGRITGVFGPVVRAEVGFPATLSEVARVGSRRLLGEIIELDGRQAVAQVYEDTSGLAPGDPFRTEGTALSVELGPGLLGRVFDGIQRPLEWLAREEGDFLGRGSSAPALDRDRLWTFAPSVETGQDVAPGAVLGSVPETTAVEHRVLVPPEIRGRLLEIVPPGPRRVADVIARIETARGVSDVRLFHRWRVRTPRPVSERRPFSEPLVTGQRVLDTFFPLPRGGAAGMPGGFGTGKTIMQQQLCKWAWADVIVYVGCGERGNEMTQVLTELPNLTDPRTGRPLSERTVLVANTSNMPVAAREASLYTAATMAEYYRDMGYHVAVLADSTSRWAEALREISGRLEEIPAEEGYPAALSSRLAAFYERAGSATALSGARGSVTLISAISPPGGDLTEPVTRHTRRFTRCFWTLDKERAEARIFPAVSIEDSDADVTDEMAQWWTREADPEWPRLRAEALAFLQEASVIERTARLIGSEGLPEKERFLLETSRLFEDGFLRQNAFDPRDAFCSPRRQALLLRAQAAWRERGLAAIGRGVPAARLLGLRAARELAAARSTIGEEDVARLEDLAKAIDAAIGGLETPGTVPAAAAPAGP